MMSIKLKDFVNHLKMDSSAISCGLIQLTMMMEFVKGSFVSMKLEDVPISMEWKL